jgi:hypothetical protein
MLTDTISQQLGQILFFLNAIHEHLQIEPVLTPPQTHCMRLIGLSPLAKQEPSGKRPLHWPILDLPLTLAHAKMTSTVCIRGSVSLGPQRNRSLRPPDWG